MMTHISNISTEVIASEDKKHTYSIKKTIAGLEGKEGIILQINPTIHADEINHIDTTTLHILNHMSELGLCSIQMINLFSKVSKGKMSSKDLEVDVENIKFIESLMKNKSFPDKTFIVAWGSSMEHSRACNETKKEIIRMFQKHCKSGTIWQLKTSRLDVAKYKAVHALFLGIRHKNEKWSLVPFDDTELKEAIEKDTIKQIK